MSLILSGTDGLSDVDGSAATPAIRGTDANTGIFFPAADTIAFAEGGAEVARFDSAGNFGIGTASPATKLHVFGSGTNARVENSGATNSTQFQVKNTVGTVTLGLDSSTGGGFGVANAAVLWYDAAQPLVFGTNNTERARIDTSGNLLVGKTAVSDTTVGSQIKPNGVLTLTNSDSTNGTFGYQMYSTGAAAYRFYVGYGGTIFATSTVITAISDLRLKENVRNLETGLDAIMALKPRRFDWKEGKGQDKKDVAGFIAQEFEEVFPECVGTSKAGGDGVEYKSINHETLIPTLVKAIQEQQALIQTLTARITALESA